MALRTKNSMEEKVMRIARAGKNLKSHCDGLIAKINAGQPVSAVQVLAIGNDFSSYITSIDSMLNGSDIVNLEAYCKEYFNDATYSLTLSLNSLNTVVTAAATYLDSALPKEVSGNYYNVVQVGSNGSSSYRSFPSAALGGFVAHLEAISNAIE